MSHLRCKRCAGPCYHRSGVCDDCSDAQRFAHAGPSRASDFDHEKDLQEQRREDEADHADMRAEVRDEGLPRSMGGL